MKILGISAFYHDSAAALIEDGKIIAAAQEERFTRKKHDSAFPTNAIRFCLEHADCNLSDVEAIAFYDKPLLKFERLLETYYAFAPGGIRSFLTAIPVWLKEKLFLKKLIRDELNEIGNFDHKKTNLFFPEHHLSHAASAFYPSAFEEAAILTVDGVGEWATTSLSHGKGNNIKILKELRFPHSLGLLYSAFTYFIGFKVNSGEYKLMGLAPYGAHGSEEVQRFVNIIRTHLIEIQSDGSIWLNQRYFNYATGLRMVDESKWMSLFKMPARKPEDPITQQHCNLALAIQVVTEDIIVAMARELRRLTGSHNLCMAGGVALNCVANGRLLNAGIFRNIFIQPASGDAGGAPGAALATWHIAYNQPRTITQELDGMKGSYLGPSIDERDVHKLIHRYKAKAIHFSNEDELCAVVAEKINEGNVIGWVNGRMEFGPRALGARSILGDARNTEMQKKMNVKIKYRESFRPFAPSILAEACHEYFNLDQPSPYMLLVQQIKNTRSFPPPPGYANLDMRSKLYFTRSELPAITHVDYSARIQTVHEETNPRYHKLIKTFYRRTGCPVIVNTSFNVRGEPIVCTAEDAYRCFMRTEMDYLVIGDFLFAKSQQPDFNDKENWQETFELD